MTRHRRRADLPRVEIPVEHRPEWETLGLVEILEADPDHPLWANQLPDPDDNVITRWLASREEEKP